MQKITQITQSLPVLLFVLFAPALAFGAPTNFGELLAIFTNIIGLLIPLIFALTFLTISWGVIRAWIMGDASSDDVDKGKKLVLTGVIVLAVMVAIWGIIRIITNTLLG